MDKESIFEISGDKIINSDERTKKLFAYARNMDEIINIISRSKGISYTKISNKNAESSNTADSTGSIIEDSDYIVHVRVNDVMVFNKYVADVKTSIIKQYKGDLGGKERFLLSSDMQPGKEFCCFCQRQWTEVLTPQQETGA